MMLTVSSQVQMCEEEVQLSEKLLLEAQKALKGNLDDIQKRRERLHSLLGGVGWRAPAPHWPKS